MSKKLLRKMWLVRSVLQLLLVSCFVTLPALCAGIWDASGFGPFKYEIHDDKGEFLCFGAYLDSETVLAAADCFKDIDYTKAEVVSTIRGGLGDEIAEMNIKHQIGIITPIENSTFAVVQILQFIENTSKHYIDSTPLCENGQLCGIVTSCSHCTDTDYSNSFIDYSHVPDSLIYAMESAFASHRDLQLNIVTQSAAKDKSQTSKHLYYQTTLDIAYANYVVQLKDNNGAFLCAGALLSGEFVVTAAECFNGIDYTKVVVVAGTHILPDDDEENIFGMQHFVGEKSKITKLTIHPEYNIETKNSNVAVLKLQQPFSTGQFGMYTIGKMPLCKKSLQANDYVKVSGWLHMYDTPSRFLHSTIIPVMTNEACYKNFNAKPEHRIFCTIGNNLDDHYSVSDLGGPAIYNGELCGIASSCSKCDGVDYSNRFTELYYFRDFIINAMTPTNCVILHSPVAVQNTDGKSQAGKSDVYLPIKIKDAPYLIQLRDNNGKFLCAGTLISNDSVLTAAVCLHNIDYTKVVVVAGAETLSEDGVQSHIQNVSISTASGIEKNCEKLALLKLKEPVISDDSDNDNIKIIPYYEEYKPETKHVQVMGWRHMYTNNPVENKLTSTSIQINSGVRCTHDYPAEYNSQVFCAVGNNYDNQFCVSDLGGPVLCGGELCGVVASCSKCGNTDYANRVIRVSLFTVYISRDVAGKIYDQI